MSRLATPALAELLRLPLSLVDLLHDLKLQILQATYLVHVESAVALAQP